MKNKGLVLDFTSLLDVIMILLFIVLSNVSQATEQKNNKAYDELQAVQSELLELSDENSNMRNELEELKNAYEELLDDYEYLKITSDYDANDTSVYEEAIQRTTRVVLLCETGVNEDTGNQEVLINIYTAKNESDEPSYATSVSIEHRFNLSKEERQIFKAEQVTEFTKILSELLEEEVNPIIWLSVQYAYDDENFSNSDLEIISDAVGNLERVYSKACYIEEIKIY